MEPFVFLGVPTYDSLHPLAVDGISCAASRARWYRKIESTSLLPHTFNLLWCACLNNRHLGFTHFAMHHADIQSPPDWLDALMEEMDRVQADVLGVVSPIKDARGLTSCGVRDAAGKIRRFTMHEIMELPETFALDDWPERQPGDALMLNTGLWVCRLDSRFEQFPGFAVLSAVSLAADGLCRAKVLSEDWNWSSWLAEQKLRLFLTRKVRIVHHGNAGYGNDTAWGSEKTDPGDLPQQPAGCFADPRGQRIGQ